MITNNIRCVNIFNKVIVCVVLDKDTLHNLLRLNLVCGPVVLKLLGSLSKLSLLENLYFQMSEKTLCF